MRLNLLWTCTLLLVTATICGAEARGNKSPVPKEIYQQMLAARVSCDAADEALFNNMRMAGETFANFCRRRGFPKSSRELASIEHDLYTIANTNPYAKDPILAREVESQFPEARTHVSIATDAGLSDISADYLSRFTPESWHAVPGSLNVVHNEHDVFLVWAAGIDGKPLKDKHDRTRIVWAHL